MFQVQCEKMMHASDISAGVDNPLHSHSPLVLSVQKTAGRIMDDDLMFTMDEEGSAQRPSAQRNGLKLRASSLGDTNGSDDDEEHFISPILGDSAKEVCNYLKDLAYTRQLSNSLPKSNFLYRVSSSDTSANIEIR